MTSEIMSDEDCNDFTEKVLLFGSVEKEENCKLCKNNEKKLLSFICVKFVKKNVDFVLVVVIKKNSI